MASIKCYFLTAAIFLVAATSAQNLPKCNRSNEVQTCVKDCPPERTCDNRGIQFRCADDNKKCRIQCRCKAGFYRNYLKSCVPEEECERCPGEHEFFDCGSECDNECSTIRTQNRTNCPYVNIQCNAKCYCKDGYARDGNKKCIPVSQCTEETEHVCKPNEVYIECAPPCPPDTCLSLVAKYKCDANRACRPGCTCKPGYLRRTAGAECRPTKYCPKQANSPDAH